MKTLAILLTLVATPALAAGGEFLSLGNSNFVVLLGFLVFVGILVWFKVPSKIVGVLDKRATDIRSELEEARALREEAKALLASYERKQKDVMEQSERIVAKARQHAMAAADQAKLALKDAVDRRMQAAADQIASAEAGAVKEVRERAIAVAVAAATEVLSKQMTPEARSASIDRSIDQVAAKLH
ncbi:F0F1 ATP synthase subunit B [Falsirhodobacter halotolerans]|uniref:F0F1 ATP synthase subunit B n=1 Tax=Falsirhodobacter halotolerans TaxID=1146892 RepID=UPI001FD1AF3B|nr:F0F1 ATP synthase subunit B [Falsirhodobacter halotolerans]MCJ8138787.1 F0F1 ATP synthase subunit B [Falsirhodobacter halotolerans]